MLELTADLRLFHEAAEHVGIRRVLGADHLHRDVAAEILVAALHHDADAAARDLAEHVVPGALVAFLRFFAELAVQANPWIRADQCFQDRQDAVALAGAEARLHAHVECPA